MRSALPELKTDSLAHALLPDIQNPGVIERARVPVRFSADDNQLDINKIFFNLNGFNQGLRGYALVPDRQIPEYA